MSCYWRLWCATCDERTEESHNHGEESLTALWNLREAVRAINAIPGSIYLRVEGGYDAPEFVVAHREHEVWLVSEYGDRQQLAARPGVIQEVSPELEREEAESARYYDAEIAPRLLSLAAEAKTHGINLVAMAEYAPGQTGHTTGVSDSLAPCFAFLLALNAARCAGNVDQLGLWLYRYAKDTPEHNSAILRLLVDSDPRTQSEFDEQGIERVARWLAGHDLGDAELWPHMAGAARTAIRLYRGQPGKGKDKDKQGGE